MPYSERIGKKAAQTDAEAKAVQEAEREAREKKSAKLRAMRLAAKDIQSKDD